jgi:transposase-like protein
MADEMHPFGSLNSAYCPHCDEDRLAGEFEFVGLVSELGNLPRFRCKKCGKTFETILHILPNETNE